MLAPVLFGIVGFIMIVVLAVLSVICYVLFSLGLYNMAKSRNLDDAILSLLPIAQLYVLGLIIQELKWVDFDIPKPEYTLPGAFVLSIVLFWIPFVGFILLIVNWLLNLLALYRLYTLYKRDHAAMYTFLSIIPFVAPFLIYTVSKNKLEI